MASSFSADNSTGSVGAGVGAIYIQFDSGAIAEIFPTRLDVRIGCRFIGSPSESGLEEIDNKVVQPTLVDCTGIIKAECWSKLESVVEEIWDNKAHRGTVHMKNGSVENMMVEELQEISTPNRFDAIEVRIRMKQYLEEGMTAF